MKKYRIAFICAAAFMLIFTAVFSLAVSSPDIDFAGAVKEGRCAEVSYDGTFITGEDFSHNAGEKLYVNGNTQNKAYVFYLKKTGDSPVFRVGAKGVDEGIFYGASSLGIEGLLTAGIYKDGEYAWLPVKYFNDGIREYIDIPVGSLPAGEGFIAVIKAQSGVILFDSISMQDMTMLDVRELYDKNEIKALLNSENMLPPDEIQLTEPENEPTLLIAFMRKIIAFIKRLFALMGGK